MCVLLTPNPAAKGAEVQVERQHQGRFLSRIIGQIHSHGPPYRSTPGSQSGLLGLMARNTAHERSNAVPKNGYRTEQERGIDLCFLKWQRGAMEPRHALDIRQNKWFPF